MLTVANQSLKDARGGRFAIIASEYNRRYVDGMVRKARSALAGARADEVRVVRVPGAFEIPVVAEKLASITEPKFSALICLGVILRGETTHAQTISESVTQSLAWIQVKHSIPVIHEVLLFENEAQARIRCLGCSHNRGTEAAMTAMEMARILRRLDREIVKTFTNTLASRKSRC